MKKLYSFETTVGTFYICLKDRIYFSLFENEIVDSDSTPEEAARILSTGEHIALTSGFEIKSLKIPADLKEWEKCD